MGLVDLHCHSTASDGTHPPAELALMAGEAGVEVLALTDHDTMAGCAELREADLSNEAQQGGYSRILFDLLPDRSRIVQTRDLTAPQGGRE